MLTCLARRLLLADDTDLAYLRESMSDEPKLYPHDALMAATVLRFVPRFVTPNQITVSRMLLTPFVLALLFAEMYTWAVPLFVLTAFTDAIDGSRARTRTQITPWGIFFDPVADKLLIGSVALLVALKHFHPAIVFAAIFFDTLPAIRWASSRHVGTVMMANIWGKTKMFLQFASITLLLLGLIFESSNLILAGEITLGVSLLFSFIAVLTYSL